MPMKLDTPEEYIQAIDRALNQGNFHQAKIISAEAVQLYPEHEKIKRYVRVLASHSLPFYQLTSNKDTVINLNWVIQHRHNYRGRWVALEKGHLIAHANSVDELLEQVGQERMNNLFYTIVY